MALKLCWGGRSGMASRARSHPMLDELESYVGREVCGVYHAAAVVARVHEGMRQALALAGRNSTMPSAVRRPLRYCFHEREIACCLVCAAVGAVS